MLFANPYALGMWLADHVSLRCYLCGLYGKNSHSKKQRGEKRQHFMLSEDIKRAQDKSDLLWQHHSQASTKYRVNSKTSLLCSYCHNAITWLPPASKLDIAPNIHLVVQAATYYDYPIKQAIRAFKHNEDMTKLPILVHAMRQLPIPKGCHAQNTVIVPMPTTRQRLARRGFDPVTILTSYLAKHWRLPIWQGVARIDDTLSQQGLSRIERLSNLKGAFAVIKPAPVKNLLLFDDVFTTGASLQSLASTLYLADKQLKLSAYALADVHS